MPGFWDKLKGAAMDAVGGQCSVCGVKPSQGAQLTDFLGRKYCEAHLAEIDKKFAKIVVSTGDIRREYDIVDIVGTRVEGVNMAPAVGQLKMDAIDMGGDGIIYLQMSTFSYETKKAGASNIQVHVDTLACGTVVRFK